MSKLKITIFIILTFLLFGCEDNSFSEGLYKGEMIIESITINETTIEISELGLPEVRITIKLEEDDVSHGLASIIGMDLAIPLGKTYDRYFGDFNISQTEQYFLQFTAEDNMVGEFEFCDNERDIKILWSFKLEQTDEANLVNLDEFLGAFEEAIGSKILINPLYGKVILDEGWLIVEQGYVGEQYIELSNHILHYDGSEYWLYPYMIVDDNIIIDFEHFTDGEEKYFIFDGYNYRYNIRIEDKINIEIFTLYEEGIKDSFNRIVITGNMKMHENSLTGEIVREGKGIIKINYQDEK